MEGRTPDERERAAHERAAQRAARATGQEAEPELEPLPPTRRTALAERPPVSRAARAQRIGRPGRPTLPPGSPKPRRWFRRLVALVALLFIGAALYVINATFQPFQDEREDGAGVGVRIPPGRTRAASESCSSAAA